MIRNAVPADAEALISLRLSAMAPSLKAAGRWDPERSKKRFLNTFIPDSTIVVEKDGALAGFYMTTIYMTAIGNGQMMLNHLYVDPAYQNQGIGRLLLDRIKKSAEEKKLPVRLEALKGSPSNDFYLAQGFVKCGESEFDNEYLWVPS